MSDATQKKRGTFASINLLFSVVVILGIIAGASYLWIRQRTVIRSTVTIDGNTVVNVEVNTTPQTRERGLSGHAPLADDQGMLFVFERADRYAFWMKEMLFPIDILWIIDGQVADITTDLPIPVVGQTLPTFAPRVPVDHVLELPAGFAAKHGLRIGSTVEGAFIATP